MKNINATLLKNELNKTETPSVLVDVRTRAEYSSSHIEGTLNLPLGTKELEDFITNEKISKKRIFILCQSGKRAENACKQFSAINDNLTLVEGGLNACKQSGIATIEGKGSISLERQVRISAGLLVLFGILASQWLFTEAIYLSAFVGAGLIFAGITDTCGMGLALSRMPWNNCNNSICHKNEK